MPDSENQPLIPRGWFIVAGMFVAVLAFISLFAPMRYGPVELVVATVITWTILLTPPIFIRLLKKTPFEKWRAFFVCIPLYFSYHIIFAALGSQSKSHTAIFLGTFAAYYILRRETQPRNAPLDQTVASNNSSNANETGQSEIGK